MKKELIAAALMGMAFLSGCATSKHQELTREEWLATTTRTYEGIDREKIIKAAERLFRLADGDDFRIAHYEEGLICPRIDGHLLM